MTPLVVVVTLALVLGMAGCQEASPTGRDAFNAGAADALTLAVSSYEQLAPPLEVYSADQAWRGCGETAGPWQFVATIDLSGDAEAVLDAVAAWTAWATDNDWTVGQLPSDDNGQFRFTDSDTGVTVVVTPHTQGLGLDAITKCNFDDYPGILSQVAYLDTDITSQVADGLPVTEFPKLEPQQP